MCLSGYAQAYSGEQVNVYPFVEYYDDHGALITTLYSDAGAGLHRAGLLHAGLGRLDHPYLGHRRGLLDRDARPVDLRRLRGRSGLPGGLHGIRGHHPGHADGTVAVTFLTNPGNTLKQGAVFRLQDSLNYWRAGRTGLHRIEAGSWVATYAYSQTFLDGDRLTVTFVGNNITVQRNGTQVLTLSNSTFNTATKVGMAVS
jgi:hypothetical protein